MRVVLGLEYDGTEFHGWQNQPLTPPNRPVRVVQACVEAAVSRVADHPIRVICAGRTDTGVHANAQVIHFDTCAERSTRAWVLGCNTALPADVRVVWARRVPETFHARFSARARCYRYVILNRSVPSALHRYRASFYYQHPLDAQCMHQAGQALKGKHDFSAFRSSQCQAKSPVRCVTALQVSRSGDWLKLEITANAFLHHMVRNIAGTLLAVGAGEQPISWVHDVLHSADRRCAGVTAAPQGLYLIGVIYPDEFQLPSETERLGFGWP